MSTGRRWEAEWASKVLLVLCAVFSVGLKGFLSTPLHAQRVTRLNPAHLSFRGAAADLNGEAMLVGDSGMAVSLRVSTSAQTTCTFGPRHFLDPNVTLNAVAYAAKSIAVAAGTGGAIFTTHTNGGAWRPAPSGTTLTIRSLASNLKQVLIAVGDSGLMLRSVDSGSTWSKVNSPVTSRLNKVAFGAPNYGVAVGNDTVILQTLDSGKSWSRMPFPYDLKPVDTILSGRVDFTALALHGTDSVWVGIERPVLPLLIDHGGVDPVASRFIAGGGIDQNANFALIHNSGPMTELVYVGDTTNGVVMGYGMEDCSYTYTPSNGWDRAYPYFLGDADGHQDHLPLRVRCAAYIKSGSSYAVIDAGDEDYVSAFQQLTVGGPGWQNSLQYAPGHPNWSHPLDLSIPNGSVGFAVTVGGGVFQTRDNGRSWDYAVAPEYGDSLNALVCLDSLTVIACGRDGALIRSRDGCRSWDTIPSATTERIHGIAFPTRAIGVIVGDFGYVSRSSDTGKSWTTITNFTSHFLYSVSFANDQIGIASGDSGSLYRTMDAGLHWSEINNVLSGTSNSIRQVQAFANGTFYARASSNLLRSTDYGLNWSFVNVPVGDTLGMSFYTPTIGIVASGSASSASAPDTVFFAYTTNSGSTWRQFLIPMYSYGAIPFHWLNDHQVLVYGIEGFIELVDFSGGDVKVSHVEGGSPVPIAVYPNPSNGEVRVNYTTSATGQTSIDIVDESGRPIAVLFSAEESSGIHSHILALPTGLRGSVFVRVTSNGASAVAKLIIE